MHKPPDYDGIERSLWRENAEDVTTRLEEQDVYILKRIQTFIDRFGFDEEAVREKIMSDRMFSAHFAKEPRRQGLHERIAAEWLERLETIRNFETLPKSGKNAWYITSDGNLRQGMRPAPSKSLDFTWEAGNRRIYASHKYTREGGGNQDSQFMEMKLLLEHFQKGAELDNVVLLVIVDGPYFTKNKMNDLRRLERSSPPVSRALPIEKVPVLLEKMF